MLLPIMLDDFLKIAEDNDRRIWHYERENKFELYVISDGVISYTEMPKAELNYERVFSSKPFLGSKKLPLSLKTVNNYNTDYINTMIESSVPVLVEDDKDEEFTDNEETD